jgi:hypothetical protein
LFGASLDKIFVTQDYSLNSSCQMIIYLKCTLFLHRLQTGQSIHIGGLVRLDVEELTVGSIYVTVWAAPLVPLHMGKTENAAALMKEHFGLQLQVAQHYMPFPRYCSSTLHKLHFHCCSGNFAASHRPGAGKGAW